LQLERKLINAQNKKIRGKRATLPYSSLRAERRRRLTIDNHREIWRRYTSINQIHNVRRNPHVHHSLRNETPFHSIKGFG